MGKKLTIFTVFLLFLGGAAIPGGILINNYIDNLLYDNVDKGLSRIKEEFIPTAEEMISEIGPAIALPMIQENALPIIEDMIYELGPAIALDTIREKAVPLVEKEIFKIGPAIALKMIKEIAIPANYLMVNTSFLTQLLHQAYEEGKTHSMDILGFHVDGGDALLNLFFDYNDLFLGPTLLGGLGTTSFSEQLVANSLPPILGVSEWWSEVQGSNIDLEIGVCTHELLGQVPQPNPNDILSWGDPSQKDIDLWRYNPPGFIQHTRKGFGIIDYLKNFTIANETEMYSEFLSPYYEGRVLNWEDFEILARYYYEYWVPISMSMLLAELQDPNSEFSIRAPEYVGMTLDEISYHEFLKQWINFSTYPLGTDFHRFIDELPPGTYGLEVNSNISISSAYALWDELNEFSFLNITGILKWFVANSSSTDRSELASHFGLTSQQVIDICNWLWGPDGFSNKLFPILVSAPEPYGYDVTVEELSKRVFYELWANGTALGLNLYPNGIDFGEFFPEEFNNGTFGFEVGIPIATGMSLNLVEALWNDSSEFSLTNITGIELWADANSSMFQRTVLYDEFLSLGITYEQIDQILDWLWNGSTSFSQFLLPILINSSLGYGMDVSELSQKVFYEQWANGTVLGLSLFPDGLDFGEFLEEIPPGTTGFEVGIPIPTGLLLSQIQRLWETSNPLSLTNITGIEKWKNALINSETKEELQQTFELTDNQIQLILDWLWNGNDSFSQNLLPILLESELGYNMTIREFANVLFLEQWANGTIMGMVMFPEGIDFHDFISSFPPGTTGFEVGMPNPTNMSLNSASLLWNTSNPYSLVRDIQVWWDIGSKHSIRYNITRDANFLDDTTMDMILKWLCDFKNNLMPLLAQYEMNLPMDATTLGNTIQLGMMIFGGVIIGITSITLIRSMIIRIKKKKTGTILSKKAVDKLNKSRYLNHASSESEEFKDLPKSRESTLKENLEAKEIKQQEDVTSENKEFEIDGNKETKDD